MQLIPTILSGGAGSRLWPVSRELHPKPFIQLADGLSLLQKAFIRSAELCDVNVAEVLTITNTELLFKTEEEYNSLNYPVTRSYILEPFGKNTAAAVIAASLYVQKKYGNQAILLILPADHLITQQDAFQKAIVKALALANTDQIVTFGMEALTPETGYGYIEADGHSVVGFVEKPSFKAAQDYVASNRFFWNSGMLCFSASCLLTQAEHHCPDILSAMRHCMGQSTTAPEQSNILELDPLTFAAVPSDSIDYALLEKTSAISMVPCNMGWSDVGSWRAISELVTPDHNNNCFLGDVFAESTTDCYIQSSDRVVGTVGVRDLMVIDTPDALLIANKQSTQDVKKIYGNLKLANHDAHKLHRTVYRPWGTYTILEEGDVFKIKRLVVKSGASLSLQSHRYRSEHWVVVSGIATVTNGNDILQIETNQSTYIPAGNKHRLQNLTCDPVIIIEVQSGSYLGEDDIVRYEDDYGRVAD